MIPWSKVIAVGLILYALYTAYKGEIDMTNKRRYKAPVMIYKRSEHPFVFWGLVLAMIAVGVFAFSLE